MRRIVLLAFVLLAGVREASANQCNAYVPHLVTLEVPLGCPFVVYANERLTAMERTLLVERGGEHFYTQAQMTVESTTLPVYHETIDDHCVESRFHRDELFDRFTLQPGNDLQVGDLVYLTHGVSATIVAAAPCPAAEPPTNLFCQSPIQDYWACEPEPDPHDGHVHVGCSAGGGVGFGLAALLAGLRRRRRATAGR